MSSEDLHKTVRAIILTEDGNAQIRDLICDVDTLGGIVGGPIEGLAPTRDTGYRWFAYIHGEGKYEGLPINDVANEIATLLGWEGRSGGDFLVGPVVIVGPVTGGGEDTGVEDDVVRLVVEFYHQHGTVRSRMSDQ